jgi:hypothetical protein
VAGLNRDSKSAPGRFIDRGRLPDGRYLGQFGDFETFAVGSVEHGVCGVVADEPFGFRVDVKGCAEGERGRREVDLVFPEVFRHATERFRQLGIVSDCRFNLIYGRVFAEAMGDVGDVTQSGRDVALLAFAGQG